jgi:hypothetical protein
MTMAITVRKHFQAHGAAAAKLVLLLLIVTSLTVPIMLSSLPLAAADAQTDCEKAGGKYVSANGGHCFTELPTDTCKMSKMDETDPQPEICLREPSGVSIDPTPSACSTTAGGTNTAARSAAATGGEGNQLTTSDLGMQIQEACIALQAGDTQGAMMNIDLALNALGSSIGDNGTQVANITNTTTTTASGATNATTTTNTTTGINATQEVDQPINSTASEMAGPGEPIKGIPMGVTETPTGEEAAGGGNNPSTATTTEPTTTTTTDGDDTGTTDTGGEGEPGEGGSSDDVDRGDAD